MTMTKAVATDVAPPKTPSERGAYTEQLTVLVDVQTREYVLGLAQRTAHDAGYKFIRQGEVIRQLLAEAIAARYEQDPEAYADLVRRGRKVAAGPLRA